MKIIVVGAGKVGITLIENFVKEGHDVVVVDKEEKSVDYIVNHYDANGIVGGGLERQVLLDAGAESADFLIACTSRDELNILCCVLAKKLGVKRTIARVRDPQLFAEIDSMREYLGLDLAFNPELQTALEIAQALKFPSAKSVDSFADGKALLVEFDIGAKNPICGKSLMQISASYGYKLLFCMVIRGEKVFIPRGDFTVMENDAVYIIAQERELAAFCKALKIFKPRAKSVFIIGGGKIAYYLAKELLLGGVAVKILESDKARCEELSDALTDATVLLGDGTDQTILDEEGLKDSDGCVTLTGIDEENVIISLYAQQKSVGKIVTKVDRSSITSMVKKLGLETVVSPRNVIANRIIMFIRAAQAEFSDKMDALYILNEKVEALQFTVGDDFDNDGVPLYKLKIKKDVLIGGIVRDGEYIFPSGDAFIQKHDKIIVVTTLKQIRGLSDIFKAGTYKSK
ncbi:MAG: Trk system potassium transporter TrkA [Clostridia bacterium]|nr:Trk system potassium transporter TrkA [Clostridia bacterium]